MTSQKSVRPVSPSFLKQKAKQLKKLSAISMSKALDKVANDFGYSNYRHYLNFSQHAPQTSVAVVDIQAWRKSIEKMIAETPAQARPLIEAVLKLDPEPEKKAVSAYLLYKNFEISFEEFLANARHLSDEFLQQICEAIGLRSDVQSELLDYYMNDGHAQVDTFATHTYVQDVYLDGITFELTGAGLSVVGSFELSVELQYGSNSDNEGDTNPSHDFPGSFTMEIDPERVCSLLEAGIEESSFYE